MSEAHQGGSRSPERGCFNVSETCGLDFENGGDPPVQNLLVSVGFRNSKKNSTNGQVNFSMKPRSAVALNVSITLVCRFIFMHGLMGSPQSCSSSSRMKRMYNKDSIMLVDWSALPLGLGYPFPRASTERRVEVACPKAAHTQRPHGQDLHLSVSFAPLL